MITGDHLETAKYVALKCGIITNDEMNSPEVAMTGEDFRAKIGGYDKIWDNSKQ